MERIIDLTNIIAALAGTIVTSCFGGWDLALKTLLILMITDYLTGLAKAYVLKELNSARGAKGILKKIFILAMLIVAVSLDKTMGTDGYMFRSLVCFFYISNEALSILENAAAIGIPIPKPIRIALEQLKEKK